MFESIDFVEMPRRTYTSEEFAENKNKYDNSVFPELNASQLQTLIAPATGGEFCLTGAVRVMIPVYMPRTLSMKYLSVDSFTWAESEAETYMRRAEVSNYLLCYTYEGEADLYYDDRYFHLKSGDGFWIDCRKWHLYKTTNDNWKHMELYFRGNDGDEYFNAFSINDSVLFHSGYEFINKLENVLNNYQKIRPERDLLVHAALTDLLGWLLDNHNEIRGGVDAGVREVIQYIHANSNGKITMDELARVANVSKYHLSRAFKEYTGLPPIEYVIETRLENAKHLLKNSDLSMAVIAQLTGIGTEQYMSRLFRQKYNMTPNEYRKHFLPL